MGNRAVIAFEGTPSTGKCIYLHWNGGRASVEGFLQAARTMNLRHPARLMADTNRAIEQLAWMIGRWFFGNDPGMTIYIEKLDDADCDNYDNGLYWISHDLHIIKREYLRGSEEVDPVKTREICAQIVARAPVFNDTAGS